MNGRGESDRPVVPAKSAKTGFWDFYQEQVEREGAWPRRRRRAKPFSTPSQQSGPIGLRATQGKQRRRKLLSATSKACTQRWIGYVRRPDGTRG